MSDSLSASLPTALTSITTRPLFLLRLAVNPPQLFGNTPAGDRRVGVITGGRFEGERLRGTVLNGGSDWQTLRPDGALVLDARITLETDDGALIAMSYGGVRRGPKEIIAKLAAGEAVDPTSYYFRTTVSFQTSAEKYAFLNGILALGTGHRLPDGPLYGIFEVV